jgi:hypothetical protein
MLLNTQPLEEKLALLDVAENFVPDVKKRLFEHMHLGLQICKIDCVTTDAGDNAYTLNPKVSKPKRKIKSCQQQKTQTHQNKLVPIFYSNKSNSGKPVTLQKNLMPKPCFKKFIKKTSLF